MFSIGNQQFDVVKSILSKFSIFIFKQALIVRIFLYFPREYFIVTDQQIVFKTILNGHPSGGINIYR